MTEQINLLAFVCTNQYAFLIKQGGKFKMKKRISLIMALTLITSMFSAMSASAAISGKKGYYSAVDSVINNHPIQSFTIDNKTVVTTTDLKDYGFSVIWDGAARAVYITRALATVQTLSMLTLALFVTSSLMLAKLLSQQFLQISEYSFRVQKFLAM
jgi:hypothetical protein